MEQQKQTRIGSEIRLFFTALMFFTRLPSPAWVGYSEAYLNQSGRYFPLVGLIVGGIGAGVFWAANLIWPASVAIVLSMMATALVTGAIHEDGFADSCDGFGGGWTKDQVLSIMKDSRVGVFGIIGLGLLLALKFFTLANIEVNLLPPLMIAGHSLSRLAAISFFYTHDYVRQGAQSKSRSIAQKMPLTSLMVAGVFGLLPLMLLEPPFWLLVLPSFIARWLMGRYFVKRIGGYTGDCLGAVQQVTEVVFYLFALL